MSYVSNVRFGQYLVWQLHIDIFSNNKEKGGRGGGRKVLVFFFFPFPEGREGESGEGVDKLFINQGGGAVAGVRVVLIPAAFVGGDGPVATEEFSAHEKGKKKGLERGVKNSST